MALSKHAEFRKAKTHLDLNGYNVQHNGSFYRYIRSKRKTKKIRDPPLNGAGDILTGDTVKKKPR